MKRQLKESHCNTVHIELQLGSVEKKFSRLETPIAWKPIMGGFRNHKVENISLGSFWDMANFMFWSLNKVSFLTNNQKNFTGHFLLLRTHIGNTFLFASKSDQIELFEPQEP